jgi:hypothetical protein
MGSSCKESHRVVRFWQLHGFTMFYAYVPITCREGLLCYMLSGQGGRDG